MAAPVRTSSLRMVLLIVCAAIAWFWNQYQKDHAGENGPRSVAITREDPEETTQPSRRRVGGETMGNYEVYRNCRLANEKHNDGDSFEVHLPDGRGEVFRLYFVDCPESDFKSYAGGDTNHKRISDQAEMLGITPEQAVQIGQQAKHFTLDLLASKPFTIYTAWDSPYHDNRFHAFVEVEENGKPRWLHELLVERGFCRIYTKGAGLPDGTSLSDHKDLLRAKEREARSSRAGAWGLR